MTSSWAKIPILIQTLKRQDFYLNISINTIRTRIRIWIRSRNFSDVGFGSGINSSGSTFYNTAKKFTMPNGNRQDITLIHQNNSGAETWIFKKTWVLKVYGTVQTESPKTGLSAEIFTLSCGSRSGWLCLVWRVSEPEPAILINNFKAILSLNNHSKTISHMQTKGTFIYVKYLQDMKF